MAELLAMLDCRWNIAGFILAKVFLPSTTPKDMLHGRHENHHVRRSELGFSDAGTGQNFVYGMVSLARMKAKLYDCYRRYITRGVAISGRVSELFA
jgi:hypothetical protein